MKTHIEKIILTHAMWYHQVLLLLVYHDIMNDRCTLNMLECDVEVSRELCFCCQVFCVHH